MQNSNPDLKLFEYFALDLSSMEETYATSSRSGSGVTENYESDILDPGLNLTAFIPELCKIAAVPFTNNNLFLLGEKILTALREKQQQLERYEGLLAGFLQVKSLVPDSDTTPPSSEEPAVFFLTCEGDSGPPAGPLPKSEELVSVASILENLGSEGTCQASGQNEMNSGELSEAVNESSPVVDFSRMPGVMSPQNSNLMPTYDPDNQYDENMLQEFTPIRNQNSEQNEVPKKKIHEVYYLGGGIYRCQCSRRFTWEKAQKHFKKYYKSDWKFMCERCAKKFYDLSNLKLHLMKQHGMEKSGNKFRTEHNVHDVHRSVPGVLSGLLGMTFFQRGRSPRQSGLPSTNPMLIDSEMDVVQGSAELGMQHQNDVPEMSQEFSPFTVGSSDPNKISELKVNVSDSQEERQLDKSEMSEAKADTRLSSQMGKVEYPIGLMSGNQMEKRTRTPSRKYLENYWLEDYEDFP